MPGEGAMESNKFKTHHNMKKVIIAAGAMLMGVSAFGALRQTNYSELDLSNYVSNGLFHGNMLLADINNDGKMEVIAKGRDLNNGWANTLKALYLDETGTSVASSVDLPAADGCNWERVVYTIDYNNDGNIDLIYGSSWGGGKLLKGNGDGTFEEVPDFSLDGQIDIQDGWELYYAGLLGVADFNGDGYQDIVTFCGQPSADQGVPVIFFNDNGTGKFIKDESTGMKPQRGGTLGVGDYNRDGFVDILVAGWADDFGNDCCRIWKNDGTGKFTEVIVGDKAGTEKGHVIFADLTGNGLLDVFVTGTSCPNDWANAAWVYKNNGDDTFTQLEVGLPGVQKSGADWCDLNGDGFIDLVYSGEGHDNSVYAFNNGDGTFTAVSDKLGKHRGGAVVLAQDFNNNGVPDIMLMGYQDGDGPHHFQVYNGVGSRVTNAAPTAPTGLAMAADGNKTRFTWNAGSDAKHAQGTGATPAEALRYNYYVKTTDGKLISNIPADPATGKLRSGNVNSASSALGVTLNISSDKVAEWGVQSIDSAKASSVFAVGSLGSGITEIGSEESAPMEYFNLQGVRVVNPENGIFIRRQGTKASKVIMK